MTLTQHTGVVEIAGCPRSCSRHGSGPTLVVSAAHDLIAPPALGRAIAAGIAAARYHVLADAAHGAPLTHAASVNALLHDHLAAVERPV